ncbi:2Fe-2S iron-sulfur cluster binding domain-containing protein [Bacillus sp. AGMB 02131]|uniref:2Fe-2S iron-sulfur cluster binding domain-containing protein n=1 Tax=Peribacillus faecalis TaxID=2772559 RepID=A0A927D218_9BACI|nr:2Fe-2S iron-sulfur cluster binding domain-containing protein [Peribacillus faecalis]
MSNFVIILYFCENSHGNCRMCHVRLLKKEAFDERAAYIYEGRTIY